MTKTKSENKKTKNTLTLKKENKASSKKEIKIISENKKENFIKTFLNKNKVFVLLTLLFLIAEGIGLFVTTRLITLGIKGSTITGDMNNPLEAIYLIVMILLMTGFILVLLKYKKQRKFLWLVEIFAIFGTSIIVFSTIILDDFIVLIITFLLIISRQKNRKNVMLRNVISIIAIAGAGSLIGISFGFVPILLFVTLLAIYDFIAVFKTKHMVALGKAVVGENLAFTVAMPTKEHNFELGNGDLVIPLVISASIIANGFFNNNILVALLCLVGSYIGLVFSIYIVKTKKIALPALPPQIFLILIIIGISFLFGL
ncbi:MAG: presenilin family intramembrane aspartyl protease [archaeon]|jgi:presenilin-like A22 family membrane protease